ALFRGEIRIVLRDGGLEHRGAEIGSVAETLGIGVVGKQAETVRVTAADIDIAGVVPRLRGIGEQVDGADGSAESADGATGGRRGRNGHGAGETGVSYEFEKFERAARADGARPGRRVIDEVGALKVNAA